MSSSAMPSLRSSTQSPPPGSTSPSRPGPEELPPVEYRMRRVPNGAPARSSGAARSTRSCSRSSARRKEFPQRTDQRLRPVLGEEQLAARHLHHAPCARDGALQPMRPLDPEEDVVEPPDD